MSCQSRFAVPRSKTPSHNEVPSRPRRVKQQPPPREPSSRTTLQVVRMCPEVARTQTSAAPAAEVTAKAATAFPLSPDVDAASPAVSRLLNSKLPPCAHSPTRIRPPDALQERLRQTVLEAERVRRATPTSGQGLSSPSSEAPPGPFEHHAASEIRRQGRSSTAASILAAESHFIVGRGPPQGSRPGTSTLPAVGGPHSRRASVSRGNAFTLARLPQVLEAMAPTVDGEYALEIARLVRQSQDFLVANYQRQVQFIERLSVQPLSHHFLFDDYCVIRHTFRRFARGQNTLSLRHMPTAGYPFGNHLVGAEYARKMRLQKFTLRNIMQAIYGAKATVEACELYEEEFEDQMKETWHDMAAKVTPPPQLRTLARAFLHAEDGQQGVVSRDAFVALTTANDPSLRETAEDIFDAYCFRVNADEPSSPEVLDFERFVRVFTWM